MEACPRFHKALNAVGEHAWIIAKWLVVRQVSEEFKVFGRPRFLARSKRPRQLPIFWENLVVMVMKM